MRARHVFIWCLLGIAGAHALAQAPPVARPPEIFLAPFIEGPKKTIRIAFIAIQREGKSVGKPVVNITNNAGGDDDQPQFLPDSSAVLFSSNRDGKQHDIYRYDIASKAVVQVTRTSENEYSPTVTPDGRTFTTIRGADERLWRFNLDGSDAGLAWDHSGPIKSHAWLSPTRIAVVIPDAQRPSDALRLIDLGSGASDVIESRVGRSLLVRPERGTVSYVRKPDSAPWMIKEVDTTTRAFRALTVTLEGSEDLAWTPKGTLVMGAQSKVMFWEEETDRWIEFADLAKAGVQHITRLTVSPDGRWIAIVAQAAVK